MYAGRVGNRFSRIGVEDNVCYRKYYFGQTSQNTVYSTKQNTNIFEKIFNTAITEIVK